MKAGILAAAISLLTCSLACGQSPPSLINYQGRLTDASGAPLPNGTYGVAFRIWNKKDSSISGNTLVWGQEYTVAIQSGIFNVILGAPGGLPVTNTSVSDLAFAFTEPERFIGLTVTRGTNGAPLLNPSEILPRQQILASPYAIAAQNGVPRGSIIMWSGSASNLPPGWALCDGSNGTPDLRDRFILGAGRLYTSGLTGGATNHVHATLPHRHTISRGTWPSADLTGNSTANQGYIGITSPNYDWGGTVGMGATQDLTTQEAALTTSSASDTDGTLPPYYAMTFIIRL